MTGCIRVFNDILGWNKSLITNALVSYSDIPALLELVFNDDDDEFMDIIITYFMPIMFEEITEYYTLAELLDEIEDDFTSGQYDELIERLGLNGTLYVTESYHLKEHPMYGSSRLGVYKHDSLTLKWFYYKGIFDQEAGTLSDITYLDSGTTATDTIHFMRCRGQRLYELTNHLGNVLAVITDRKLPQDTSGNGRIDYYLADVVSAQDYYPGGSQMPGRVFTSGSNYRYGFNGQEKDDEMKGDGHSLDFEFRIYDPRLGRFLSIDPLTKQYPMLTPYQFASNRPIDGIDIEGKEWKSQHKWGDKITDESHIKALGSDYVEGMTYQQAWTVMAPKLLEAKEGDTYDCADLSITVMVEFAYTFKLPVYVEDYKAKDKDPTFDNDKYGYKDSKGNWHSFKEGDWKGLADAIAGQYGAADLYNNRKLTTEKSFDDLQAGDLVGWDYPNGNVYHSQTVNEVGDSWWFDFDDKIDYYKTIQGSLSGGQGVPAFEKEYDIDAVKKDGNGSGAKTKALRWNTENFDKHK